MDTQALCGMHQEMIEQAMQKHGTILPCGYRSSLEECFTALDAATLCLWYSTPDGSTHVVVKRTPAAGSAVGG
jgi:D-alanyl-D-alanine dipeptidase